MQSKARCEIQRPPKYKAATSEGDRTHTTAQCKNVFELTSLGCASLPYSTRHDNARRLYTTEPLSLSQGACRAEPASTDGGSNGNRAPPAEQLASHTGYSYPTGKRQPTPTGEAEQPRTVSGTAMQDFSIFFVVAWATGQLSPTGEAEQPRTAGGTAQQAGNWHSCRRCCTKWSKPCLHEHQRSAVVLGRGRLPKQ